MAMQHSASISLLFLLSATGCLPPDPGTIHDNDEGSDTNADSGNDSGNGNSGNSSGSTGCDKLQPRNDSEVALCNDLGEGIIARVAYPAGSPPAQGWPGVMVLHGSGGLFDTNDDDTCSEEPAKQFRRWSDMLTARGYAVVMPASFYSRGFCDWNDAPELPPGLDDEERLVMRTFDAAAAARYLCDDPRVDCNRLASIGFSNGASTLLMLYHEDHRDAEDERLQDLDGLPSFVGGVAYYPGCGLQAQIELGLDEQDSERFYFPRAPVLVAHASEDSLLDNCEEVRDPEVDFIAEQRGVIEDMFDLQVYAGADHGFDGSDDQDPDADRLASETAEAITLQTLETWF